MTNALRTWIAGLALAFSAIVLTAGSDPRALGATSLLAFVVLFTHAWIIAVAERVGSSRGGVEIQRFPLGPRLIQARPGLFKQFLVPVALLALVTQDPLIGGLALIAVIVLSIDLLRAALPYLIPAGLLVWGLLTMNEFHTLGDLLVTGKTWMEALVKLALWTVVLCGTLLRTDVAAPLPPKARLVSFLAGLPGYGAAFWIFTRTALAGAQPDLLGLCLVLLAGGVFQSIVVGLLAKTADLGERLPHEVAPVDAHDVGLALLPLGLIVLGAASFALVPIGPEAASRATPAAWAGLLAIVLVVPLVLGAALVADALDRVDGRRRGRKHCTLVVGLFVGWFLLGPQVLTEMYGAGGVVDRLRSEFRVPQPGWAATSAVAGKASWSGPFLGGDFTLWGLPAADLSRAATLMVLGAAALAARLLRHARRGLRGPGWGTIVLTTLVQLLGLWLLMPRLGPVGAGLATAAACGVMLLVDALTGIVVAEQAEPERDFEGLDTAAGAAYEQPVVAPEIVDEIPASTESIDLVDAEPSLEDILGGGPLPSLAEDEDQDSPSPIAL